MDETMYIVPLSRLEDIANRHFILPQFFGVVFTPDKQGEVVYCCDLAKIVIRPEPNTLDWFLENAREMEIIDPGLVYVTFYQDVPGRSSAGIRTMEQIGWVKNVVSLYNLRVIGR